MRVNKSRRSLLLGSGAILASGVGLSFGLARHALAQAASTAPTHAPLVVTVVEIANFQCSRCYAVNGHFDRLARAAYDAKIDLIFAPATWEGQSLWPDRVYYAARDLFPRAEPLLRDALFQGIHEEGQLFETLSQVRQYFIRKGVEARAQEADAAYAWDAVAAKADSNDPLYSEIKVGRLIDLTGIEEVPSFLWLGDGRVVDLVTPSAGEPRQIVAAVIKKLSSGISK